MTVLSIVELLKLVLIVENDKFPLNNCKTWPSLPALTGKPKPPTVKLAAVKAAAVKDTFDDNVVNAPVLGVVAPIAESSILPPSTVKSLATMSSVID